MADNLALWHSVEKTDPAHVKPITGKSYSGNSPKPHWLVLKATERFGPCGIGWGFSVVKDQIVNDGADMLHFATVRFWYVWEGTRGEIEQIGGTPLAYTTKSGKRIFDEDAPKKSVTDALIKAMSMVGFAGDIFLGRWDDQKYVHNLDDEFRKAEAPTMTERLVEGQKSLEAAALKSADHVRAAYSALDADLKPALKARSAALVAEIEGVAHLGAGGRNSQATFESGRQA